MNCIRKQNGIHSFDSLEVVTTGHRKGIEDKIDKMEEILKKLIAGMDVVMIDQASAWNEEMEGNDKENAKDVKPVY